MNSAQLNSTQVYWVQTLRAMRPCHTTDVFIEQLRRNGIPDLMNSCTLTADVAGRQFDDAVRQSAKVTPNRSSISSEQFWSSVLAVAGPSTWNSLPDSFCSPALSLNMFRRHLNRHRHFYAKTRCAQRIRDLLRMRYKNWHFTILLTSLLTLRLKIINIVTNTKWIKYIMSPSTGQIDH